jgi:hypothetical protein
MAAPISIIVRAIWQRQRAVKRVILWNEGQRTRAARVTFPGLTMKERPKIKPALPSLHNPKPPYLRIA